MKRGPWRDLARTLAWAVAFAVPLAGLFVSLLEAREPRHVEAWEHDLLSTLSLLFGFLCGWFWGKSQRAPARPAPPAPLVQPEPPPAVYDGPLDAWQIVSRDRDEWKRRALAAEKACGISRREMVERVDELLGRLEKAEGERDFLQKHSARLHEAAVGGFAKEEGRRKVCDGVGKAIAELEGLEADHGRAREPETYLEPARRALGEVANVLRGGQW